MSINKKLTSIFLAFGLLVQVLNLLPSQATLAASGDIDKVTNFSATSGNGAIYLSWQNPQDPNYAGTLIVRSNSQINWLPTDGKEDYSFGEEVETDVSVVYYSTGTAHTDTGITNGQGYIYQAFTYNYDANYSGGSNQITETPLEDTEAPNAPTNLVGISGTESINLSWDESSSNDVVNYEVTCNPINGNSIIINNKLLTSLLITDLDESEIYTCIVKAIDASVNISEPSNEVEISPGTTLDTEDPNSITDLTAVSGTNQVTLNWSESQATDLSHYKIYATYTDLGAVISKPTQTTLAPPFIYTDLDTDTTYSFRVTVIDTSNNESDYSNLVQAEIESLNNTNIPQNLNGETGHLSVSLNWSSVSSSTLLGFNAYKKCSDENNYTKANTQIILQNSTTIDDLIEGSICEFYVTSIDENHTESGASNEVSFTIVEDFEDPSSVSGLNLITGNDQVYINWNTNPENDLEGYNIYLNENLVSPPSPVLSPPLTLVGLTNGAEYELKVCAIDQAFNEGTCAEGSFSTPNSHAYTGNNVGELSINNLNIELDDSGRAVISWNGDLKEGTAGFNLYRGTELNSLNLLNKTHLLTESPFTDTTSVSGFTYYYQFSAVGLNGKENDRSEIMKIKSKDAFNAGYFLDVLPGHIFFDFIEILRLSRITQGYSGHLYKPDKPITRVEALKIIMKSAEIEPVADLNFHNYADVESDMWYHKYVQTASLEGIVRGYDDGYFRPNKNISRIEFLKMVMESGYILPTSYAQNIFPDMKNDFWGTEYSGIGYSLNIISGYEDGLFRPNRDITRAEAAKIVSYLTNH